MLQRGVADPAALVALRGSFVARRESGSIGCALGLAFPRAAPDRVADPNADVGNLRWGEPVTVVGQVIDPDGAFDGGPGAFVTVSNTEISFSTDGIHWEAVDSSRLRQ